MCVCLHVDDDPGPSHYGGGRGRGGYYRGYGRGGGYRGGPRSVSMNNHASSGGNPYNLRITRMSHLYLLLFGSVHTERTQTMNIFEFCCCITQVETV